jgi:hypothetical protein
MPRILPELAQNVHVKTLNSLLISTYIYLPYNFKIDKLKVKITLRDVFHTGMALTAK